MKKILLLFAFLLFSATIFAQHFSQYNTGTLYDSFENPAQRAFTPDTSKTFAFNFLLPTISSNLWVTGNSQASLKSRLFLGHYNDSVLKINQGKFNHAIANVNIYFIMAKMYISVDGDEEIGFSGQMRGEGRALFSDESAAIFNGTGAFGNHSYTNVFNNNYYFQLYNQLGFTYREKFDKYFSFGVKLSALLGIDYQKATITSSSLTTNNDNHTAVVGLAGTNYVSYVPGNFDGRDFIPNFRNPGASISVGTMYRTDDAFIFQGNIKDLGFIHWSGRSRVYHFDKSGPITGLDLQSREDSVFNRANNIIHSNATGQSFTTATNGLAEISVNKSFRLDEDGNLKYSPTLVASKELFYPGFVAALVNPIQYKKYSLTLTTTYDDLKQFNVGLQFMIKKENSEFFIGSDQITHTLGMASNAISSSESNFMQSPSGSGVGFFIGYSLKFGPVIEHPMNASVIPTGEKGFLGRLWGRIFKTND